MFCIAATHNIHIASIKTKNREHKNSVYSMTNTLRIANEWKDFLFNILLFWTLVSHLTDKTRKHHHKSKTGAESTNKNYIRKYPENYSV